MELMIAIAIVVVLATIVVPSYLHYTKKTQFADVVRTADQLKVAVSQCAKKLATVTGCNGGAYGIPLNVTAGVDGRVSSVTIVNGVITVTPQASNGFLLDDTYVLTPTLNSSGITWTSGGGACAKGYVPGC